MSEGIGIISRNVAISAFSFCIEVEIIKETQEGERKKMILNVFRAGYRPESHVANEAVEELPPLWQPQLRLRLPLHRRGLAAHGDGHRATRIRQTVHLVLHMYLFIFFCYSQIKLCSFSVARVLIARRIN